MTHKVTLVQGGGIGLDQVPAVKRVLSAAGGQIEWEKDKLFASGGTYEIGGTASLGRALDLKLIRSSDAKASGSQIYSITGTVAEPRVTLIPTADTQAQLKP